MGCLLSRMGCSRLRMGCQSIWADRVRLAEARCTDLARVNAILQTRLAQVCESRNGKWCGNLEVWYARLC